MGEDFSGLILIALSMNRLSKERTRRTIIAALYPIPNPLESEEDWLRATHQDLDSMTKAELTREYDRVECRLKFEDNPHDWLVQRKERLSTLIQPVKQRA